MVTIGFSKNMTYVLSRPISKNTWARVLDLYLSLPLFPSSPPLFLFLFCSRSFNNLLRFTSRPAPSPRALMMDFGGKRMLEKHKVFSISCNNLPLPSLLSSSSRPPLLSSFSLLLILTFGRYRRCEDQVQIVISMIFMILY